MTNPTPAPAEHRTGFEATIRDGGVPEAALAAAIRARPTDTGPTSAGDGPVRWVRAADAVTALSSATAGHGIDLHRELARRIRATAAAVTVTATDRLRPAAPTMRAVLPSRASDQLERRR